MSRRVAIAVTGIVSGALAGVALLLGKRTVDNVKKAVASKPDARGAGATFAIHATGYWPFSARPDEQRMEGGTKDRKGNPLFTLEMYQAGKAQFVSVSGDPDIFPYGQRLAIAEWPGIVFRVTDTGSHFHGAGKVYRVVGREPLDICVASSTTKVVANTDATIYPGDHFDKAAKTVALDKIGKPTAVGGLEVLGVET